MFPSLFEIHSSLICKPTRRKVKLTLRLVLQHRGIRKFGSSFYSLSNKISLLQPLKRNKISHQKHLMTENVDLGLRDTRTPLRLSTKYNFVMLIHFTTLTLYFYDSVDGCYNIANFEPSRGPKNEKSRRWAKWVQ